MAGGEEGGERDLIVLDASDVISFEKHAEGMKKRPEAAPLTECPRRLKEKAPLVAGLLSHTHFLHAVS